MNRKKEYVLLVILGVIVLAAGRYLFQVVWEDYHEAAVGYQKLQEFIIEKPDTEIEIKIKI